MLCVRQVWESVIPDHERYCLVALESLHGAAFDCTMSRIHQCLGLATFRATDPMVDKVNHQGSRAPPMLKSTAQVLDTFYRPFNSRLCRWTFVTEHAPLSKESCDRSFRQVDGLPGGRERYFVDRRRLHQGNRRKVVADIQHRYSFNTDGEPRRKVQPSAGDAREYDQSQRPILGPNKSKQIGREGARGKETFGVAVSGSGDEKAAEPTRRLTDWLALSCS